MRRVVPAGLLLSLAALLLLFLAPTGSAQTAGPCPIVHISDDTGDVESTAPQLDETDIDITAACVAAETATHLIFAIQTAGTIDQEATQTLIFVFNFKIGTGDHAAQATIDANGETAGQKASSVRVEGNVLTLEVPKGNIDYTSANVGQPVHSMYVDATAQLHSLVDPEPARGSDRAPDSDFGQPYIGGSLAEDSQDTDGDGVPDRHEFANNTDPQSLDTDGDGLLDGPSVTMDESNESARRYFDAGIYVSDRSGGMVTFAGESTLGTNATMADTDGDGLIDGGTVTTEFNSTRDQRLKAHNATPVRQSGGLVIYGGELDFGADPTMEDTDGDGIPDGEEVSGVRNTAYRNFTAFPGFPGSTDPAVADSDGDGLNDFQELSGDHQGKRFTPTDPNRADTDGDGLSDFEEVTGTSGDKTFSPTDPTNSDSDGDGFNDGLEVEEGSDPTDPNDGPKLVSDSPAEQTDWVYALLSTVLLLGLIFLAAVGILVRWG